MGRGALAVGIACVALAVAALFFVRPPKPKPPASGVRSDARSDAPSVLLITLDTTRADALHCYGAVRGDASPNLDTLAAEGVRFAQARTTVPMSLPSHSSIMTGQWPFETGVRDNTTFRLGSGANTLAERFKAAGYATGAVVGSFVLHSVFGLNQGFDHYVDPPDAGDLALAHENERGAAQLTDECLRLFDEKKLAPPFFLWAHFFDPHFPYEPPEPFLSRFLAGAPQGGKARARYGGEVAFMDQEIGRLLAQVRTRLAGRPLIVLAVGDHGESLGDHGEDTHGLLLYDTSLRVPCLLAGSGLPHGTLVSAPLSTIDLAPTLLELCGLEREGMSGVSWVDRVRAPASDGEEARPLYYEVLSPWFGYGWSPLFAVGLGPLLFIDGPRPELFDVVADPGETKNLVDARPEIVKAGRLHFERWRAAAQAATATVEHPELSQEERDKIAHTGYVSAFNDSSTAIPAPGQVDVNLRDPRDGTEILHKIYDAQQFMAQGKVKPALALANELLELDGDDPMVQQLAGTTLMAAGQAQRALPLLEKAVARRADFVMRFTLAQAHRQLGHRDEALRILDELVKGHGELLRARFFYGELLLEADRRADAAAQFEYFLAHCAKDDGQKEKARQLLERTRAR